MEPIKTIAKDEMLRIGWGILAVSLGLFCIPLLSTKAEPDGYVGWALLHFILAVIYWFLPRLTGRRWPDGHRIHYRIIGLVLLLISAFALNRSMEIFADSSPWFSALLVVLCLNLLMSVFVLALPVWFRYVMIFFYGAALVVFIYLAIYLFPLYVFSFFALIALGISVHTFVPLLFVWYISKLISVQGLYGRRCWLALTGGIVTPLLVTILFVYNYSERAKEVNRAYSEGLALNGNDLPTWVHVASVLEKDDVSEKLLKTELVYLTGMKNLGLFWNIPRRSLNDERPIHDPLVVIGNYFSKPLLLPEAERIKVLGCLYASRHQALDRLWSGDYLATKDVQTGVRVWPELHLAYTEKIITVASHAPRGRLSEEAIYTMHLPEGGVVTSLSLWINGVEEKGILTTKEQAAIAYNTIVGGERRDPSVVHWQEGNTVSVRVYPVVPGESRTFKIGVTAPLRMDDGRLAYDNIWFEGPNASEANETVRLYMESNPRSFVRHASYQTSDDKVFTASRNYRPHWTLHFDDPGIRRNVFSFNGNSYAVVPNVKQRVPVQTSEVYLDINESWSRSEFDAVWELVKDYPVYVYNNGMQALYKGNRHRVFDAMQEQSFSLFPFHLLSKRSEALVISKSASYSPNLSELSSSAFHKKMMQSLQSPERVRLFHLGTDWSPYLQSLSALRLFQVEFGKPSLLKELLQKGVFAQAEESDGEVMIASADIRIVKRSGTTTSTAPDHLLRLFTYNDILKRWGRQQQAATTDSMLVRDAKEAYVVSPVSSLVVLETKADYDRFGINDKDAGLKNASLSNKGAVPEPAESALIITAAGLLLFFLLKWKLL